MTCALDDDSQIALDGVLDGIDDVRHGGRKHDDCRAEIGGEIPRLAGVVPAAVVGEDELVVVRGAHLRLLERGRCRGLTI